MHAAMRSSRSGSKKRVLQPRSRFQGKSEEVLGSLPETLHQVCRQRSDRDSTGAWFLQSFGRNFLSSSAQGADHGLSLHRQSSIGLRGGFRLSPHLHLKLRTKFALRTVRGYQYSNSRLKGCEVVVNLRKNVEN
jgi:hypothetical protein